LKELVTMEWIYPVITVFVGYLVLGITGFGSALVIVPLLAWRWPLPEVVALTLLMDVPASALLGGLNFKQVNVPELRRLLPGLLVGMAVGLWLVGTLEPHWPLLLLGLFIALAGLNALRTSKAARAPWSPHGAHMAGLLAGVVQMMFGTAGPVVLGWLQRRVDSVHVLRATTPAVMMIAASGVLLFMAWGGRLSSPDLWQRWLVLIGVALLAVSLGHRLSRHVPVLALKRIICMLLVVSGLMLVWRATR
jgi:uncharacterized protein